MRELRPLLVSLALTLAALVLQATLFRRIRFPSPDLVLLVVILSALSLRPELALLVGFLAGVLVDLTVAVGVLGLRALVYTMVAFVAVRTRHRTDIGPWAVGLWAAALSLGGVTGLLVLGALFGQAAELGDTALSRLVQVPLINGVLATLLSGWVTRLIAGRRVTA